MRGKVSTVARLKVCYPMHIHNVNVTRYAVEHTSRINRIIRQKGGHALLVGLGGSGRQSLAKLAAFIAGVDLFRRGLV